MSTPWHRAGNGDSALRDEVADLRKELASTSGEVAAIGASMNRLADDLQDGQKRIEDKLGEVIGLKERVEDHTHRVARLEDDKDRKFTWKQRAGWVWLGVTGVLVAGLTAYQFLGK